MFHFPRPLGGRGINVIKALTAKLTVMGSRKSGGIVRGCGISEGTVHEHSVWRSYKEQCQTLSYKLEGRNQFGYT